MAVCVQRQRRVGRTEGVIRGQAGCQAGVSVSTDATTGHQPMSAASGLAGFQTD